MYPVKSPRTPIRIQGARLSIEVGPFSSRSNTATASPPNAIASDAIVTTSPRIVRAWTK